MTQAVEYVEFAVRDLKASAPMFEAMDFERIGVKKSEGKVSELYAQGDIRLVLSASSSERDDAFRFTRAHGDGISRVGYRVADASDAFEVACQLGADGVRKAMRETGRDGAESAHSLLKVFGDVQYDLIALKPNSRFDDFFPEQARPKGSLSHKGKRLQTVDHITVNVEKGQVDRWAKFHEKVFGFREVRYFDIHTDKTGLISRAIRNPNGRITMPFNEPTEDASQIQEFLDVFQGPGVQHLAFHTSDILDCLSDLRSKNFKFLTVPSTYYDEVPKRVQGVVEKMSDLEAFGILVDGGPKGYLLQIFTEPMIGPFFFEFIQRKGDDGFGEGNFKALFEAIERDQIRRGVL